MSQISFADAEYASKRRQFDLTKVRFKGRTKNTAHIVTLFALSHPWMARRTRMGEVRPKPA